MNRRNFINKSSLGLVTLPFFNSDLFSSIKLSDPIFFKLSLAQFSLFRPILNGEIDVYDFAKVSREEGFDGLEYMTTLYKPGGWGQKKSTFGLKEAKDFANKSNKKADEFGQENVLLMIDGEGDLSRPGKKESTESIENHYKWIDAAAEMNCHSVRVNLYGSTDKDEWKKSSIENLSKLCEYAKDYNINVIVENHNNLSSDADLLVEVIKGVDHENFGTLPDFGGWCLEFDTEIRNTLYGRARGKDAKNKNEKPLTIADACKTLYDRYDGMKKILPFAKAVSAKSHVFDEKGENMTFSYKKMMKLVKDSGYKGFIGVEYSGMGGNISALEGIRLTKNLIIKYAKEI